MFPTVARLSKASRRPLTPKRGNKDFYKGTRQAFLPGGHRTGAPGVHVIRGSAKYRLEDEKVRVYVAPPLADIESSPLRPYVYVAEHLKRSEARSIFGRFPSKRGLTPEYFLQVARGYTFERQSGRGMKRDKGDGGKELIIPDVKEVIGGKEILLEGSAKDKAESESLKA
ncbi:hypothetical protein BDQ12DRAFT_680368 [Crucibulum laeve]|uniref:Mitochondrial ribosomal protein L27-domain-containing protein n=1 Tax=Crucibulum laeve TaxID=68775 RepID=A0A5C3M8D3_9AGAR|nr:hypothetical protein BDQ12DRAFT_680368 [Crucibulum laeve]